MTKEQREEARAKAWANYIKVRDRENKAYKAIYDKHGRAASGWGKGFSDEDEIKRKIAAEIQERFKVELAKAKASDEKKKAAAKALVDAACQERDDKIAAAWQAFEVLDIGGRTKKA